MQNCFYFPIFLISVYYIFLPNLKRYNNNKNFLIQVQKQVCNRHHILEVLTMSTLLIHMHMQVRTKNF